MMDVETLLETQIAARDQGWEDRLLAALPTTKVRLQFADPKPGPDGWPYLFAETSDADEPLIRILEWLSTRGIGLALNPSKNMPDFVLTYGMIWNFRERGQFLTPVRRARSSGQMRLSPGAKLYVAEPSASYLPDYVRSVLKQFFADQGIWAPKIAMLSDDGENYDLCFSIESLGTPPTGEHAGIAEALGWFLPSHYSIALVSERLGTPLLFRHISQQTNVC